MLGLDLDAWQEHALEVAMSERDDGRWAAFEFAFCVPRQNGKTRLCVARMLAGLFLLRERLQVYSAHQFKTAKDTYDSLREIIDGTPALAAKVAKMPDAHGEQGIYFKGERKPRLIITARGKNPMRGFSADTVYFDEAMDLPDTAVSAMLPTLARRPNSQIWYLGSAVDQTSMDNGIVFARKRAAALGPDDPGRLAYLEYSMPGTVDDFDMWDIDGLIAANPALDLRPDWTMSDVDDERPPAMSRRGFAVERCGIGDWPDPEELLDSVIPKATWAGLRVSPESQIISDVSIAVDVSPDRRHAAIALAGVTAEGRLQVEVIGVGAGTTSLTAKLTQLVLRLDPMCVVLDKTSAGASLITTLEAEGIEADVTSATELGQACGGLYDDADAGILAHLDDPLLNDALADAGIRKLGDAWAWNRRGKAQITPLVAVTLARYGFVKNYKPRKTGSVLPVREIAAGALAARTDDLATTGF